MQNDTPERTELQRMADDGCPQGDDTKVIDVAEMWSRLGKIDA